MSRWWRAEDTSIDHPKLLRLSDAMHRAWYTLMCIASANDGVLPPTDDIALRLRMKPAVVAAWITHLVSSGLFDNDGGLFRPHNWNSRQYKSDVTDPTNAERQKRYRNAHRNGVTAVTHKRPETETDTEAKTDSEANASGANAPPDPAIPEREYFERGRQVLGSKSGAMIANLLKAKGKNVALARSALEEASQKQSPIEYVAAICRGPPTGRPLTAHQLAQQETRDILDGLDHFARGGGTGGQADPRLLSDHSGERSQSIRGGAGQGVVELSAGRGRAGG